MNSVFFVLISMMVFTSGSALALSAEELLLKLSDLGLGVPVESVSVGPMDGFYRVVLSDGSALHTTQDGKYFIYGDLYRVAGDKLYNHDEEKRNERRRDLLNSVDESETIVFAATTDETLATVTVFTDIDCGFCRKFHEEVPEMNSLGITVRYMAFPRTGIFENQGESEYTPSFRKLRSVWCADKQQYHLTLAKTGHNVTELECNSNVEHQYAMGQKMNVAGTPAIIYEDGRMTMGYRTANQLALELGIQ